MATLDNPLRKYFRQPAIHLRLPSGGRNWPAQAISMPPNGELPIYPMTAVDEITSRTPDALFNGSAVTDIIRSCVPAIHDPWATPASDITALLVAIRLASYGHSMEMGTKCPKCSEENEYSLDLRTVLDGLKSGDYETPLQSGDLTIYFTPMTYQQLNENNRVQFEDQKMIQSLNSAEIDEEEKLRLLTEIYKKVSELTVISIRNSITMIKTADAIVSEPPFIDEFLRNCRKEVFEAIRDRAVELREQSDVRPLKLTCPSCQHQYEQTFTLDLSNFFETAS